MKINIACGDHYVSNEEWINIDWASKDKTVFEFNLLEKLPYQDGYFETVYCSHYFEHIKRDLAISSLGEWFRILKPGGILRIVVPDFEEIVREYVKQIDLGNFINAEYNAYEILDQCVRTKSGGESHYWNSLANSDSKFAEYISSRTGTKKHLRSSLASNLKPNKKLVSTLHNPRRIWSHLTKHYIKIVLFLLPKWFRENQVSLVEPGEKHFWVYDKYQIKKFLRQVGFVNIDIVSATESNVKNFPFFPLDIDEYGDVRKGRESMFIEAIKPF